MMKAHPACAGNTQYMLSEAIAVGIFRSSYQSFVFIFVLIHSTMEAREAPGVKIALMPAS
jgi:hypothetical protein